MSQNASRVSGKGRARRGGAMLEVALLSPWVLFLFMGAFDWGFYSYSLISIQAAARSAALYTRTSIAAASDTTGACAIVLGEMKALANVRDLSGCDRTPLTVTTSLITGPDSTDACRVTVTYQTPSLLPLPRMLSRQFTITRTVTMKL